MAEYPIAGVDSSTNPGTLRAIAAGDTGVVDGDMRIAGASVSDMSERIDMLMDAARINNIGTPGQAGFGVGICPGPLPPGMSPLPGYTDPLSDNYGNYQYSDGSIMVWVPAFYYRIGHQDNPTYGDYGVNSVDVLPFAAYSVAAANAAGYALHRAFYDGGAIQPGVFVDKYLCSNNGGIASSLRYGNPLSSSSAHNPYSGLNGSPPNNHAGAIDAVKTRGENFFASSLFIFKALALISLAHAQAATSSTYCGWYDENGITNYPKGCNNNALGDTDDGYLSFISDGYDNACQTGSANILARTTHNGQNCGIADLNGCMWEVAPGITMDSDDPTVGHLYVLSTSVAMKDVTSGASLETDLWGSAGLAALYDDLGLMSELTSYALDFSERTIRMGSAEQALSADVSGLGWQMTAAGIPLLAEGTNMFGNDGIWDYARNHMCPRVGGYWSTGSHAGVWSLLLNAHRASSAGHSGCRAALYL